MATPIQRIEKEHLLRMLNNRSIPLKCFAGKTEYTFGLRALDKDRMVFESSTPLTAFRENTNVEFKFSLQSAEASIIAFSVFVFKVENNHLVTSIPDCLYKNLSRLYARVRPVLGLNLVARKDGFYYDLNYERINVVDSAQVDDFVSQLDEDKVNAFLHEHLQHILQKTDGYELSLFAHSKSTPVGAAPRSLEEKAVGKLGKILFISIPDGGIAAKGENAEDMFFTEWSFFEFLLQSGERSETAREKIAGLLRQRREQDICGDCYVPVVFHSYIIGCIHIWVKEGPNPPLTFPAIETFRRLAKIIAFSLEHAHYFEDGKKHLPTFSPRLLDMSPGGFLFALRKQGQETMAYAVNDRLAVQITISARVIRCRASIIRAHTDRAFGYYGCKFDDMKTGDARFLFEALYGKPFTQNHVPFICGAV
jgi:hypothetical protein